MTPGQEIRIWRDALTALITGFAIAEGPSRPGATTQAHPQGFRCR
jgi:hypothetical protein